MQIGEKNLVRPQQWIFRRQRFFDFHDEVSLRENGTVIIQNLGARLGILFVRKTGTSARIGLNKNFMAHAVELIDDGGQQRDSVLLFFDLLRNTYFHVAIYLLTPGPATD